MNRNLTIHALGVTQIINWGVLFYSLSLLATPSMAQTGLSQLYVYAGFSWALLLGEDEFGNSYYRSKSIDKAFGHERRMVIYKGDSEASKIPPGWFGWMHHKTDISPVDEKYQAAEWQNPHLENQTGTPRAYRPEGSLFKSGSRPKATGDYQAWKP